MAVNAKHIQLVNNARPDKPKDLTISPGTTVAEAKKLAKLDKHVSIFSSLGGAMADEEVLYDSVNDGDKLTYTPKFTAGRAA